MIKTRLLTPGPTDVPAEVLLEMARPMIHHRTPEFVDIFAEAKEGLKKVFCTEREVIMMAGSGTAGMESAIVCACPRDKKTLIVNSGKFGERWVKIGKQYGLDVDEVVCKWGETVSPELIEEKLATGEYGAVVLVYSETSTATACDMEAIAKVVGKTDAILICDAITACGTLPLKTDEWGVDIVASGSQKAFMLPPGLAVLTVSDKAWKCVEANGDLPAFYLDLKAYRKSISKNSTPYTGPVSLVRGLKIACDMLNEVGIEKVWKRSAILAKATREACTELGLGLRSQSPSDSVTAIALPEGVDDTIRKVLKSKYGYAVAGGQDDWKGNTIRVSHMGYVDIFDTIGFIAALEYALVDCGYNAEIGKGVAKAVQVLKDWE